METAKLQSVLESMPALAALAFGFALFLLYMAVKGSICFLIISALRRVPAEHRQLELKQVWLLLVPLFGYGWNFFVYRRVAASFESFFAALGMTSAGRCSAGLALAYCMVELGALIPRIGLLPWGLAWVLLILLLVRFHGYSQTVARLLQSEAPGPADPKI